MSLFLACAAAFVLAPWPRSAQEPSAAQDPAEAALASRLTLRASSLPRAALGTHEGWHTRPLPPLYDLALRRFGAGDTPAAIELLVLLLEREPDLPGATLMLGGMYFRLRRYEDSVEAYRRFLAHAPEEVQRTRHLGHALHSLGRHAEALAHYDLVLARPAAGGGLDGEARAFAHRGRGLALHRLGRLDEAREALGRARELAPRDAAVHLALARVDEERGAFADARASALAARELAPFDPAPLFLLATLADELGDAEGAAALRARFAELASLAAEIDDLELRALHRPGDAPALEGLARRYAELGDVEGVIGAIRRLDPATFAGSRLTLELLAGPRPELAEAAAARLAGVHGAAPEAWEALAGHHARQGRAAEAAAADGRAKALRGSPGGG